MKYKVKHITKESLFCISALLCLTAIIIISELAHAGFDISKLNSTRVISDLIINAAITILSITSSVPMGISSTKQRSTITKDGKEKLGKYRDTLQRYQNILNIIKPKIAYFNQWHNQQYLKEVYDKQLYYLQDKGIRQAQYIFKLDRQQILTLDKPQYYTLDDKKIYFHSLTPIQIEACLKVIDGKIKIHKLPDQYYLYAEGRSTKTFYEEAYYESLTERKMLISKTFYKIALGFCITCIFTGLTFDYINMGDDANTTKLVYTMLINIFSRLLNTISSSGWGYLIGQEHVYLLCYYLEGRIDFLQQFASDTTFQYQDDQTIAKAEYLSRMKQENLLLEGGSNNE